MPGLRHSRSFAFIRGSSILSVAALWAAGCAPTESGLRQSLARATGGVVQLPAGEIEITSEILLPPGARDLEIAGHRDGTALRAAVSFRGRALLVADGATRLRLRNFTIDGNRAAIGRPAGLPPYDVPFERFTTANGILVLNGTSVTIASVQFREIAGFAVLVSRSGDVVVEHIDVGNSGGRKDNGRNNTTGGVLMEEGTTRFQVRNSVFRNILGNGVWTHSLYTSPRNQEGAITGNMFENIGRDAIQVGHATRIVVENNTGRRIGYPVEAVDVEGGGTPVGVDTAGNVDASTYARNHFTEINGKCIDLDGFHHGEVRGNTCVNAGKPEDYPFGHFAIVMNNTNPDMQSESILVRDNVIDGTKFGGIFVIGSGHQIVANRLRRLNRAGCRESAERFGCTHFAGEPALLETGIYLGRGAERPAPSRGNLIADNEISGHKMKARCIAAAPGIAQGGNTIRNNRCADQ